MSEINRYEPEILEDLNVSNVSNEGMLKTLQNFGIDSNSEIALRCMEITQETKTKTSELMNVCNIDSLPDEKELTVQLGLAKYNQTISHLNKLFENQQSTEIA